MPIEMHPVESKAVSHQGYDPETKTLRVCYQNGGIYEASVEPEEYHALMAADSFGRHLNATFRLRMVPA